MIDAAVSGRLGRRGCVWRAAGHTPLRRELSEFPGLRPQGA